MKGEPPPTPAFRELVAEGCKTVHEKERYMVTEKYYSVAGTLRKQDRVKPTALGDARCL